LCGNFHGGGGAGCRNGGGVVIGMVARGTRTKDGGLDRKLIKILMVTYSKIKKYTKFRGIKV
jgi:hypothetical protein